MKKLLVLLLFVSFVSCNKDKNDPNPQYAKYFVGTYETNTSIGGNSTNEKWVVTEANNLLNIDYTRDFVVLVQGKELRSNDRYRLKDIQVLNPISFKIDQNAEVVENGAQVRTEGVMGEVTKSTNSAGIIVLGTTLKFLKAGASNPTSTDFLEFKKQQ